MSLGRQPYYHRATFNNVEPGHTDISYRFDVYDADGILKSKDRLIYYTPQEDFVDVLSRIELEVVTVQDEDAGGRKQLLDANIDRNVPMARLFSRRVLSAS